MAVLSRAVDQLAATPLADLCVRELQQLALAAAQARSRLAGVQAAALAAVTERSGGKVAAPPGPDGSRGPDVLVQHWWRDAVGAGAPAAGSDVRTASRLTALPLVLAAVQDGRLPVARAVVLLRLVGEVAADALAEAEPNLLAVALERDPQQLGQYVAHLLATWCEPAFEAAARTQEAKRYLQTSRDADGMLSGRFRLTSADSETFLTLIEPLARRDGLGDQRSAGQRRADALVEGCRQVLAFGDLPDAGGFRPQVSYVVPAGWASGAGPVGTFADLVGRDLPLEPGAGGPSRWPVADDCALGAWSGPQTRSRIETVLCDARLTRVLLDSVGQVKGLEALRDTVTATQRRALAARDHGCAVRGCTRPPAFCDAHHLDHLADGGETALGNLVLLCRRHHLDWHAGRVRLQHLHVPWITSTHDPPF